MLIKLLLISFGIIIFAIFKIFQIRIEINDWNIFIFYWNLNKKKRMNIILKL